MTWRIFVWVFSLQALVFINAVKADTLHVQKLYATFKSFRMDKFHTDSILQKVQPIVRPYIVKQENEYYFYKRHQIRSLAYHTKTYAFIFFEQEWYVNAERLGIGIGFNRVLTTGKYWVVLANKPQYSSDKLDISYQQESGLFVADSNQIHIRQHMYYAFDTVSFQPIALTFAGMLKLLNAYPSLQMQFVKDKYNDDPFVILSYIKELNRYVAYFEQQ